MTLVVGLLTACQPLGGGDVSDADTSETASVSWIYDGDTIEVERSGSSTDVRLMGINAPDAGECFFDEALDYLIENLKGREVELVVVGLDQFDRMLAYVWAGGMSINLDLVGRGLAIATTPDGEDDNGSAFLQAEEEARAQRTGLWGESACNATGPIPTLTLEVDPIGEVVTVESLHQEPIDLEGWVLRDESSRHRYTFSAGDVLTPGGALHITTSAEGWDPGDPNVWNNDGDMAMILDDYGRVIAVSRYP